MVKGRISTESGNHLHVIGLSARNLEMLQQGKPITFPLAALGIEAGGDPHASSILICYGQTEQAIVDELKRITLESGGTIGRDVGGQ